ncbi:MULTISPECIES: bifunctional 2-polyprenyl-6-hydroxyphenol methylase/3-demethylubiquinol 3-O-methyltransferase UbiG [unclassified Isoptericola]|uniref:class I SAM-dependent methyltransferase n=1 Tax=unclassified Isoptericola TaxID=2623355 RepID=UPI002712ACD9|nr:MULTISPECIES: methyltransferase domain-containing protein [unclassified Isoptericola]MDO8143842.1 methyltransferase domain-containing protein [Isoptericola sp. 178]MDO8147737.1 methyltransferase domain-containing protein [Isoptericola sp. b515]
MAENRTTPWLEEWDRGQRAYFGETHKEAHFSALAGSLQEHLPPDGVVLDFGPGDALHAGSVLARCRRLVLCEAAPAIRAGLTTTFAATPEVRVIEPQELRTIPAGSVDLVLAHSVLQYLTDPEVDAFLSSAARLLPPRGVLLLGDLIRPGGSALADLRELLRFARRGRFVGAAVARLATLPVTSYARTRREHGLVHYSFAGLARRVGPLGFDVQQLPANLGNNEARWTMHAVRRGP